MGYGVWGIKVHEYHGDVMIPVIIYGQQQHIYECLNIRVLLLHVQTVVYTVRNKRGTRVSIIRV